MDPRFKANVSNTQGAARQARIDATMGRNIPSRTRFPSHRSYTTYTSEHRKTSGQK